LPYFPWNHGFFRYDRPFAASPARRPATSLVAEVGSFLTSGAAREGRIRVGWHAASHYTPAPTAGRLPGL